MKVMMICQSCKKRVELKQLKFSKKRCKFYHDCKKDKKEK